MTDLPRLTPELLRQFADDPRTTEEQRASLAVVVKGNHVLLSDLEGIPAYEEWEADRQRWLLHHTKRGTHGIIDTEANTFTVMDDEGVEVVTPLDPVLSDIVTTYDQNLAAARSRVLGELGDLTSRARALQEQIDDLERQISPLLTEARDHLSVPLKDLMAATGYTHNQVYSRIGAPQDEASQRARAGERRNPRTYVTKGPGVGVREASRQLGVSETAVRKRVAAGTLPHTYTDSGRLRILLKE